MQLASYKLGGAENEHSLRAIMTYVHLRNGNKSTVNEWNRIERNYFNSEINNVVFFYRDLFHELFYVKFRYYLKNFKIEKYKFTTSV